MSNPTSQSGSRPHGEPPQSTPAVPEFACDCDPGDESDSRGSHSEPHARSGTKSGYRAAPLPSGF